MAKENNTLLALVAVLLFSAIGYVIKEFLDDTISGMNETGIVGEILDIIKTPGLLAGLLWLVLCIIIYYGAGSAFSSGENIGPISLTFLLLWLFTNLGILIGIILWQLIQGGSVNLDLNVLVDSLIFNLTLSLGPAFASALGISNKGH